MTRPFFSVIITAYNVGMYICCCIESVIHQTFDNIEMIIVDDGSDDDTFEKCEKYALLDSRIKIIKKNNGGVCSARKAGIIEASGDYVIFVDGDDWIDRDMCDCYYRAISDKQPDLLLDSLVKEYGVRSEANNNIILPGYYDERSMEMSVLSSMMFTGNFYEKGLESYICAKAVRKDIIKQVANSIYSTISFGEGGLWLYSAILASKSMIIINEKKYHYRMRSDSMTMTSFPNREEICQLYDNLLCNICKAQRTTKSLINQLDYMTLYWVLFKDIDWIRDKEMISPFCSIGRDSKIAIYGAWRYGRSLYKYITENKLADVVLLVDRNYALCSDDNYVVSPPSMLLSVQYDYIVVGTMVYSSLSSILEALHGMGIEDKALYFKADELSFHNLPEEIIRIKEKYIR